MQGLISLFFDSTTCIYGMTDPIRRTCRQAHLANPPSFSSSSQQEGGGKEEEEEGEKQTEEEEEEGKNQRNERRTSKTQG